MEMEEEEALQDNRPTLRKEASSSVAASASASAAAAATITATTARSIRGPRTVQNPSGRGSVDPELEDDDKAYEVEEHDFLPPEKPVCNFEENF